MSNSTAGLLFAAVFAAWYILISITHYLLYYIRRIFLLHGARREYEYTHGMASLGDETEYK